MPLDLTFCDLVSNITHVYFILYFLFQFVLPHADLLIRGASCQYWPFNNAPREQKYHASRLRQSKRKKRITHEGRCWTVNIDMMPLDLTFCDLVSNITHVYFILYFPSCQYWPFNNAPREQKYHASRLRQSKRKKRITQQLIGYDLSSRRCWVILFFLFDWRNRLAWYFCSRGWY
jgi:hypothetical protein